MALEQLKQVMSEKTEELKSKLEQVERENYQLNAENEGLAKRMHRTSSKNLA